MTRTIRSSSADSGENGVNFEKFPGEVSQLHLRWRQKRQGQAMKNLIMMTVIAVGVATMLAGCGVSGKADPAWAALSPEDAASKCRWLYMGMLGANMEREENGLPSIFPAMDAQSDNNDDISGKTYKTSTEYLKVLFDCENYGKDGWSPFVDKRSVESWIKVCDSQRAAKLKGRDMPIVPSEIVVPKDAESLFRTHDLIVVAFKDFDQQWDGTPLFISSNVNPANLKLPMAFSDRSVIPIGSKAGRDGYSWKDDFVVIARKGGAVDVIAADKFTVSRFCGGEDIPAGSIKFLDIK